MVRSRTVSYRPAVHIDGVHSAVVRHAYVVKAEFVVRSVEVVTTESYGVPFSEERLFNNVLFSSVLLGDSVDPQPIVVAGARREMICHIDSCIKIKVKKKT